MKNKTSLLTMFFSLGLSHEVGEAGETRGPKERAGKGLEGPRFHVLEGLRCPVMSGGGSGGGG